MSTSRQAYSHFTHVLFLSACIALACTGCGPKRPNVKELRAQKAEQESLLLDQYRRTISYSDSLLAVLMPQVDEQLTRFKYEKDDRYEDHGHYAHHLLATTRNTERCFLQPYVSDNLEISIRSYYYGEYAIGHESVTLSADSFSVSFEGSTHRFESKSPHEDATTFYHEVMTLQGNDAVALLRFVDAYRGSRTKVTLKGRSRYAYYISENDRQALLDTYQLAVLMQDIHQLEQQKNQAENQILRLTRARHI